jgi:hypothetical protein
MKENFIKKIFTDENGNPSSKRVAGMMCVLALVTSLVANTFSHGDIKPSDALVDAVALFAFGSLGLTSLDKYSGALHGKKKDSDSEES